MAPPPGGRPLVRRVLQLSSCLVRFHLRRLFSAPPVRFTTPGLQVPPNTDRLTACLPACSTWRCLGLTHWLPSLSVWWWVVGGQAELDRVSGHTTDRSLCRSKARTTYY